MDPQQIFAMKQQLAQRAALQRLLGGQGGDPTMGQTLPQQGLPQMPGVGQPQIDPNMLMKLYRMFGQGQQQQVQNTGMVM